MNFDTLFFDLDETLYPAGNGVWEAIAERINLYLHEKIHLEWEEIPARRHQYYTQYGTTLRGLETEHHIDVQEYLGFVHDIPLAKYLQPDASLREMLLSFPQPKHIFTNADARHAERVLRALGVEDCFEDILDVNTVSPYCKPQPEAYQIVLQRMGLSSAEKMVLIDDKINNLKTASQFGFFTVLVGESSSTNGVDAQISHILELPTVLNKKD